MAIEITIRVGKRVTGADGSVTWKGYGHGKLMQKTHLISVLNDFPLPMSEIGWGVIKMTTELEKENAKS